MKRSGWVLGALAALAGCYPYLEARACEALYSVLSTAERPRSADVVAVFGGGGGARIRRGLTLLRTGYAPRVLFLGTGPEMQCARLIANDGGYARSGGFGPGRIAFGPAGVENTSDSVIALVAWCKKNKVRRALVVSDQDHLGRVSLMLNGRAEGHFEPVFVNSLKPPPPLDTFAQRWKVLREGAAYLAARAATSVPGASSALVAALPL